MPDANPVASSGSAPDEDMIVRVVEAQVNALRVHVAALAEVVRLLPSPGRRSAVTETIGAVIHNLGELVRRLHRSDGRR
jgi:hypothetical protein